MHNNCEINDEEILGFGGYGPLSVGDSVPNFEFDVFKPGDKEELTKMSIEKLKGAWFVFFF